MPRKNENSSPRLEFGTGTGAQPGAAYFPPPPLRRPKYTRRNGGR